MKHSKHLWVRDIFGNAIIITDVEKAIEQAKFCSNSPFKMDKFSLRWYVPHSKVALSRTYTPQKMERQIPTSEKEMITVGHYNKYILKEIEKTIVTA